MLTIKNTRHVILLFSFLFLIPSCSGKRATYCPPCEITQVVLPPIDAEPEHVATPLPAVDDTIKFGDHDWRVLDVEDGKALLLSEKVIETRPYHLQFESVTWESSNMRTYLNTGFLQSFSPTDRERILDTKVVNNDNPWYNTIGCGNTTTDKIFLLNLEEVVQYFGDSGKLKNRPGQDFYFHDQYSQSRIVYDKNGKASWWWLRSPGDHSLYAAGVNDDGDVYVGGYDVGNFGGIRPALWLNLEPEIF